MGHLADPQGNELCILSGKASPPGGAHGAGLVRDYRAALKRQVSPSEMT
jgi:hypothetical protein